VGSPVPCQTNDAWRAVATSLLSGQNKAVLLGNAAAHHQKSESLLALANWIADQIGGTVGYLTEAANTVGAALVGVQPGVDGLGTSAMLESDRVKAFLLLNVEPTHDVRGGSQASTVIGRADLVVTLSPFKANMDISDVLLPIAPFTETAGSFVNAEARLQSFHAVVKPLGETRPAWKVIRVLGSMLSLSGMEFSSVTEVLAAALPGVASGQSVDSTRLSNFSAVETDLEDATDRPCTASIYQLDSLVRRAASLQLTADARAAVHSGEASA